MERILCFFASIIIDSMSIEPKIEIRGSGVKRLLFCGVIECVQNTVAETINIAEAESVAFEDFHFVVAAFGKDVLV